MTSKIILISPQNINKDSIVHGIIANNDTLNVCNIFTTNSNLKDKISENFEYFMHTNDIEKAYKNNSLFFVTSENEYTYGMTLTDLYSNDIVKLDFIDFNNIISEQILKELLENSTVCFIDSSEKHDESDLRESGYVMDKLSDYNTKYFYFINEPVESIARVITLIQQLKDCEDFEGIERLYELYN